MLKLNILVTKQIKKDLCSKKVGRCKKKKNKKKIEKQV